MSIALNRKIGERVRELREERGWTQVEFAQKLGWPQPRVSEVERGAKEPMLSRLERLAKILRVPLTDLVQK